MQKMKKTIEGGGSELFICFTSRTSAASSACATATTTASTRIPSSKSLMSPNRSSSNPSIPSLSSSLSRRLRSSGSAKGGQSPMFPAAGIAVGRKKGAAFEAAEPSSPKVTCIGQVRVKSKKKKAKNSVGRSRSGREASFRRSESAASRRSRKTVSICDALRSFGSEMNCFVPCGWSCSSRGDEETAKRAAKRRSSSCGAVFARWLMAIEEEEEEEEREGEEIKRREFVGLVVTEKEIEVEVFEKKMEREEDIYVSPFHSRTEDILVVEKEVEEVEEEEEKGRVSVCVPPRNALLLMRCRSDPVRMAALANRFWDSPAVRVQCEEEGEEEEEVVGNEESEKVDDVAEEEEEAAEEAHIEQASLVAEQVKKEVVLDEKKLEGDDLAVAIEEEKTVVVKDAKVEEEKGGAGILGEVVSAEPPEEVEKADEAATMYESREKEAENEEETTHEQRGEDDGEEIEIVLRRSISCSVPKSNDLSKAKDGGRRRSFSYREKKEKRRHSFSAEMEARRPSFSSEKEAKRSSLSVEKEGRRRWSFSVEKENLGPKEEPKAQSWEQTRKEERPLAKEEPSKAVEAKIAGKIQTQVVAVAAAADEVRGKILVNKKGESQVVEREKKSRELPDCLLLMMYEPKLSMEVSKETWVCSTDFLRWRPNYSHPANQPPKTKGNDEDDSDKIEEKCSESKNMIAVATANTVIAPQTPLMLPPAALSPIEQKLLKSPGIVPLPQHFVLTRCKSEPVKSSARLAPESCFWKSRHQPIGTAGLGF